MTRTNQQKLPLLYLISSFLLSMAAVLNQLDHQDGWRFKAALISAIIFSLMLLTYRYVIFIRKRK